MLVRQSSIHKSKAPIIDDGNEKRLTDTGKTLTKIGGNDSKVEILLICELGHRKLQTTDTHECQFSVFCPKVFTYVKCESITVEIN